MDVEVGARVKVRIWYDKKRYYKENREFAYRIGTIEKIYPNFVLVKLQNGCRECFFESDIIGGRYEQREDGLNETN